MKNVARYFPWFVVAMAALFLLAVARPRGDSPEEFHLHEFARLPVQDNGRFQPMDTYARIRMMLVSNEQSFQDVDKARQPAVKWILDGLSAPIVAAAGSTNPISIDQKVFRVDNDQIVQFFRLEPRSGFRYSLAELQPQIKQLDRVLSQLNRKDPKLHDTFDVKMRELGRRIHTWELLFAKKEPFVVPGTTPDAEWVSLAEARDVAPENRSFVAFQTMLDAYARGKPQEFNAALERYREGLEASMPGVVSKVRFEVFFNEFAPFLQCLCLYVLVVVLLSLSWLVSQSWPTWQRPLYQAAFWLTVVTFAVHAWAILARMIIMGRPPVTNLYASAVFIGWGSVGLCLVLEVMFRNTISLAVAAVTGFFTLIIAHNLVSGDTMDVLLPVLDTNLWLATHVVIITLGYTATFVAGKIGVAYIILGVVTPVLGQSKLLQQALSKMIYGVICFAMLLSFTGTVLGGLWADYSWGRFWGWDPKENGALLIVIWNALILHARWAGMIKQRGLAVLAVAGNIVVSWSWFGTNMLPVGLHSYGRMEGALAWLLFYVCTQLLIIGAGMLPLKYWYSFAPKPPLPPPPAGGDKRGLRGDLRTGMKAGVPVGAGGAPSTGIRPGVARA